MSFVEIANILKPKAINTRLIRIGGSKDGAYLLPDCLDTIDRCFSPGVSNRKNFEDELAIKWKIKSHMYNFSSDIDKFATKLIEEYQTFQKK